MWKFSLRNNFTFSSTFGGTLYAYYEPESRMLDALWKPVAQINGSLYKTFLDDRLELRLDFTIWRHGRRTIIETSVYMQSVWNRTKETRAEPTLTSKYCSPTAEGVSLLAISDAADGSRIRGQNRIPLQANQNAEAAILISDRSLIRMMLRKSPDPGQLMGRILNPDFNEFTSWCTEEKNISVNQIVTKHTAHPPSFETGQMCSSIYSSLIFKQR